MEERIAENKMGVMPVGKLLLNMAAPMVISMMVQALYNVVDSMFVARVSEDALSALSLAFPMQNFMIAVASGLGVGFNALISRSLGARRQEAANRYAMQGIFLEAVAFLVFVCIGLFFSGPFIAVQAGGIETIERYGTVYLTICCGCSFGFFAQITMERLLQSTGRTLYSMVTQATGAIVNIVLDPILIFGLFGAPKLGVAGAAIATVVAQCCAAALAIYFNLKKNHDLQFHISYLKPEGDRLKEILLIGVPSILMMSIGSVMTFCVNKILITFTSTAVAVFGAYFKLQSFVFMPVFGLNNGMVPIVSYNYGARKKERMERTILLCFITAQVFMLVGFAIFQLFPAQLLLMFGGEDAAQLVEIGVPAMKIISLAFLVAGFCVVSGSICQALGHGFYSLTVSFCRQLVVLVPVVFLLSRAGVLELVWWAWPIAEVASLLLSIFFVRRALKKLVWDEPPEGK